MTFFTRNRDPRILAFKRYRSQAQRNLMEACRHGAGYEGCPPDKVLEEFHQKSKGRMKNKDLPVRSDSGKRKSK